MGEVFVPIDPQLKVRHFKEIAWASYEFDKYISETKGFTDAEIAYREGQRMDDYRANSRPERDGERQPTQTKESQALLSIPFHGHGPKVKARGTSLGQASAGRNRQAYVAPPVTFTHNSTEGPRPKYDQPPAHRGSTSVDNHGAPIAAAVHSRSKVVQQPLFFPNHGQERQRHELFESQYEEEEEEEPEYERSYEGSSSLPTIPHVAFENTNQRGISPRRHQLRDFPAMSRKPAVFDYSEDPENDEDTFDS